MNRLQANRRLAIAAAAVLCIIVIGAAIVVRASRSSSNAPHAAVAGCMTKESKVPDFAKQQMYDANGLPQVYHYARTVADDEQYVGDYKRAYRATNLNTKTLSLAPFQKSKPSDPKVYVDKSSGCKDVYVAMAHGPFSLAVYTRK